MVGDGRQEWLGVLAERSHAGADERSDVPPGRYVLLGGSDLAFFGSPGAGLEGVQVRHEEIFSRWIATFLEGVLG